jgi:adenylate cyclase
MAGTHERRLAAIMVADVVAFSRLMGSDEDGTFDALKARLSESVNPLISRYGGRVFKLTGDGFLAEFGSAVQAVECAVAVQHASAEVNGNAPPAKRLQFRIGINLGDVIADGDDLFGDGVNVAARLEPLAEPGGISVSQAIYDQVSGKVGVRFSKLGPRTLKNIAKPIQVFRVELDNADPAATPPVIEDRPSIAVLAFQNLSNDAELGFLSLGLLEDVITLLARVPGFFVINARSSLLYEGGANLLKIGRELGVRYVVQGSIRAAGSRVRVVAQLVEAETGRQLWSRRFDVERSETLDLQDEMARAIMVELEPELTRAELTHIKHQRPDNLDAWSHYRKAAGLIAQHGWNIESVPAAIEELREAIRLDPHFALAHALFSLLNAFGAVLSMVPDNPALRKEAREAAARAIALDPESSDVLGRAGCAIADLGEEERGCELLERAIENDPSNAQARIALGAAQARLKRFDVGIENMRTAMRISPRDVSLGFWGMMLARALLAAHRTEEALAEAKAAGRRDSRLHGARAVALMRLGRPEEARAALAEAHRIHPGLTTTEIAKFFDEEAVSDLKPIWPAAVAAAPGA